MKMVMKKLIDLTCGKSAIGCHYIIVVVRSTNFDEKNHDENEPQKIDSRATL